MHVIMMKIVYRHYYNHNSLKMKIERIIMVINNDETVKYQDNTHQNQASDDNDDN